MNKIKLIIYAVIATVIFASCGPSAAEKEAWRLADSTRVADSAAAAKNDTLKPALSVDAEAQERRIAGTIDATWATVFSQLGGKFAWTSMFAEFKTEAQAGGILEVNITDDMNLGWYIFSDGACNIDSNKARYPIIATRYKDSTYTMSEASIDQALSSFLFPKDMKIYSRTENKKYEGATQNDKDSIQLLITSIAHLCTQNNITDRSNLEYGLIEFSFNKRGEFYCTYQASNITTHLYVEHCLWSGKKPYVKVAFVGDRNEKTFRDMNLEEQKNALRTLFNFLKKKTEKGKES